MKKIDANAAKTNRTPEQKKKDDKERAELKKKLEKKQKALKKKEDKRKKEIERKKSIEREVSAEKCDPKKDKKTCTKEGKKIKKCTAKTYVAPSFFAKIGQSLGLSEKTRPQCKKYKVCEKIDKKKDASKYGSCIKDIKQKTKPEQDRLRAKSAQRKSPSKSPLRGLSPKRKQEIKDRQAIRKIEDRMVKNGQMTKKERDTARKARHDARRMSSSP